MKVVQGVAGTIFGTIMPKVWNLIGVGIVKAFELLKGFVNFIPNPFLRTIGALFGVAGVAASAEGIDDMDTHLRKGPEYEKNQREVEQTSKGMFESENDWKVRGGPERHEQALRKQRDDLQKYTDEVLIPSVLNAHPGWKFLGMTNEGPQFQDESGKYIRPGEPASLERGEYLATILGSMAMNEYSAIKDTVVNLPQEAYNKISSEVGESEFGMKTKNIKEGLKNVINVSDEELQQMGINKGQWDESIKNAFGDFLVGIGNDLEELRESQSPININQSTVKSGQIQNKDQKMVPIPCRDLNNSIRNATGNQICAP